MSEELFHGIILFVAVFAVGFAWGATYATSKWHNATIDALEESETLAEFAKKMESKITND